MQMIPGPSGCKACDAHLREVVCKAIIVIHQHHRALRLSICRSNASVCLDPRQMSPPPVPQAAMSCKRSSLQSEHLASERDHKVRG